MVRADRADGFRVGILLSQQRPRGKVVERFDGGGFQPSEVRTAGKREAKTKKPGAPDGPPGEWNRVEMLSVATAIVATTILIPTVLVAVVTLTGIGMVSVIRSAARSDVEYWMARRRRVNHWRRAIRYGRRAVNDGRQTTRCGHHHGGREQQRHPKGEVHRPTRLRRGGEPSNGNHCHQTEEMFCLHERFDYWFKSFFNEL